MLAFIVSRLLQSAAVMLAVSFLCFVLFNFVGDPVNNMVGQEATPAERAEMRRDLGLEDSVAVQFARFLGNAATGNFGKSYRLARPVSDLIVERMPATLELVAVAALLALSMGIPLGVLTALRRHKLDSGAIMTFSLAGVADADLRDRHPADLCLLGGVQELGAGARPAGRLVLPLVRPRRDGEARLVEHRPR